MSDFIVAPSHYEFETTYTTLTTMKPAQIILTNLSSSCPDPQSMTPPINSIQGYEDYDDEEIEVDSNDKNTSGQSNEPCLVCGGVAKGLHFQVKYIFNIKLKQNILYPLDLFFFRNFLNFPDVFGLLGNSLEDSIV